MKYLYKAGMILSSLCTTVTKRKGPQYNLLFLNYLWIYKGNFIEPYCDTWTKTLSLHQNQQNKVRSLIELSRTFYHRNYFVIWHENIKNSIRKQRSNHRACEMDEMKYTATISKINTDTKQLSTVREKTLKNIFQKFLETGCVVIQDTKKVISSGKQRQIVTVADKR